MPFINRLPVDGTTGRAVVSDTAPASTDPYLSGIRFTADGTTLYILTGAVPATAAWQDGFARDPSTGRMCALIDSPPAANLRVYNDGVLGDADGHMCFTAVNAIATYMHGWPLDSIGQVCIGAGTPPPPLVGAALGITNFALYNDASGTTLGAMLTNGSEVISLAFTPDAHFSGGPYSGVDTPPLVGTIAAGAVPSSDTATCTNQFTFLADVANIVKIDFNASYTAADFPSATSVIVLEVKLHDDTGSSTAMDWFPDGASGHMSGGTVLLDPTSLNRTIATASLTSGHWQCRTPILSAGHTYTLTVTFSVTNS